MEIKLIAKFIMRKLGYEVINLKHGNTGGGLPKDFSQEEVRIYARVRPFTMTSPERIISLIRATRYIMALGVEGAFVECGVFKGGSMMAVALTLLGLGQADRELFLYDTYVGMAEPTAEDEGWAHDIWQDKQRDSRNDWAYGGTRDEVQERLESTGYDKALMHFVQGLVEDTIPDTMPEKIALLRLDTDFYQSTRHELEHLLPRLQSNGILIIDDYAVFQGSKRAVDEYFEAKNLRPFLNRIDADSRLILKNWG